MIINPRAIPGLIIGGLLIAAVSMGVIWVRELQSRLEIAQLELSNAEKENTALKETIRLHSVAEVEAQTTRVVERTIIREVQNAQEQIQNATDNHQSYLVWRVTVERLRGLSNPGGVPLGGNPPEIGTSGTVRDEPVPA